MNINHARLVMRYIIFFIIALLGINSIVEARSMTPKEAQERARIVTMGGD